MSAPAGGPRHWRRCPAAYHSKYMNATPGNDPSAQMKASDADRDAVLSVLSEHFQAGRLTADESEDRTGRALAARTCGELRDLLQDLPRRSGPPGRTVLVPIAALAGIGIAVAMSAGTAHARWGVLWLVLLVLLIARRMTCCAGAPRRSGPRS
jgi:hypothetical protein